MAIVGGYKGELDFSKDGSDAAEELDTASLYWWRLTIEQQMSEITAVNQSAKTWKPDLGTARVEFRGYIDQLNHPGNLNRLPASIVCYPDKSNAGNKMSFDGWLTDMVWESGIGGPNRISGTIIANGDLTVAWA